MVDSEVEEGLAAKRLGRLLETAVVLQINLVDFDELEQLMMLDEFEKHQINLGSLLLIAIL